MCSSGCFRNVMSILYWSTDTTFYVDSIFTTLVTHWANLVKRWIHFWHVATIILPFGGCDVAAALFSVTNFISIIMFAVFVNVLLTFLQGFGEVKKTVFLQVWACFIWQYFWQLYPLFAHTVTAPSSHPFNLTLWAHEKVEDFVTEFSYFKFGFSLVSKQFVIRHATRDKTFHRMFRNTNSGQWIFEQKQSAIQNNTETCYICRNRSKFACTTSNNAHYLLSRIHTTWDGKFAPTLAK